MREFCRMSYFLRCIFPVYQLTGVTYGNLKIEGCPKPIIDILEKYIFSEFLGENYFLKFLQSKIGARDTTRYKSLIFQHSNLDYLDLPDYGEINEVYTFCLSADRFNYYELNPRKALNPIIDIVRRETYFLNVFIERLNESNDFKYLINTYYPTFPPHTREQINIVISWFRKLVEYVRLRFPENNHPSFTDLEKEEKNLENTIRKLARRLKLVNVCGHPKISHSGKATVKKEWEAFCSKGMKGLASRYRNLSKKKQDLENFLNKQVPGFLGNPEHRKLIDKVLNTLHKKKSILKAIFGYLMLQNRKREIKPASIVRQVNRLMK